ncbi:MAG: CPXCG motif-containing cysteine-rich protein [Verrucomicrobiota bacterium]
MQESCHFACPYCGGENELSVEPGHADQEWIEDCTVCCQPMLLRLENFDDEWEVSAERP